MKIKFPGAEIEEKSKCLDVFKSKCKEKIFLKGWLKKARLGHIPS